eukprot:7249360-Prymnesium_polylepis.1
MSLPMPHSPTFVQSPTGPRLGHRGSGGGGGAGAIAWPEILPAAPLAQRKETARSTATLRPPLGGGAHGAAGVDAAGGDAAHAGSVRVDVGIGQRGVAKPRRRRRGGRLGDGRPG